MTPSARPGSGAPLSPEPPRNPTCPTCGHALPAAARGRVLECPGCRNPVLVPSAPAPTREAPADVATEPAPTARVRGATWVLLATLAVGIAYAGLFALLTAEARGDRANLRRDYGDAVETATEPASAPGAEGITAWRHANDAWAARRDYERLGSRVAMFRYGFLGAFLVQTAIVVGVWLKTRRPRARPSPRRARAP